MQRLCPPALVKNGTYLHPMNNWELIGLFLLLRAEFCIANNKLDEALKGARKTWGRERTSRQLELRGLYTASKIHPTICNRSAWDHVRRVQASETWLAFPTVLH